jgi:hypothetical protein
VREVDGDLFIHARRSTTIQHWKTREFFLHGISHGIESPWPHRGCAHVCDDDDGSVRLFPAMRLNGLSHDGW